MVKADPRTFWDGIAPTYDQLYQSAWSRHEDTELSEWLTDAFDQRTKAKVLDIGCGTGLGYALIKSILPDCDYVGVDISDNMLETFRTKYPTGVAGLTLYSASSDELSRSFPEGTFDIVVLLNATGSYVGGPSKVLRQCRGLLTANGVLFASFLNRSSLRRCVRGEGGIIELYKTRGAQGDETGVQVIVPTMAELQRRCARYGFHTKWVRYQSVLGGVIERRFLIPLEFSTRLFAPQLGHTVNLLAMKA